MRKFLLFLHRYFGLLMAGFIILEGLTGSILVYRTDLERLVVPQLFATPNPGATPLDLAELAEHAEALEPKAFVAYFSRDDTDRVVLRCRPRINPATGQPYLLDFDHLFLNPWTGAELGRRLDGDISQGLVNLLPFIYKLHWQLLAGQTGIVLLGIISLIWSADCFIGFYLTFPAKRKPWLLAEANGTLAQRPKSWWQQWQKAWWIKPSRFNYDLHRASGLWLWPLLFIFAWSSVMLELQTVYERVMGTLFEYTSIYEEILSVLPAPLTTPRIGWRQAQAVGQQLMAQQAELYHFTVSKAYGIGYIPEYGSYAYGVRTSLDRRSHGWDTSLIINATDGTLMRFDSPAKQATGNKISNWLWGLHFADIDLGAMSPAYGLFVCFFGVAVSVLSVTGVIIWWRKTRTARAHARKRLN